MTAAAPSSFGSKNRKEYSEFILKNNNTVAREQIFFLVSLPLQGRYLPLFPGPEFKLVFYKYNEADVNKHGVKAPLGASMFRLIPNEGRYWENK